MNVAIKNEIKPATDNFSIILKKFGALVGFFLGLILMITGVILSIFTFVEKINFDNTELVLILTSFVLFGFGAHCLDLLETEKIAKRG